LLNGNEQQVIKQPGELDFNDIELDESCDYYIGHVQAPTSAVRKWSYDTSHPFESLSWSVVHNGVLTNWKDLVKEFVDWDVNPVDTAVIPNLLQHFMGNSEEITSAPMLIKKVLAKLEGTYALCVVDTDTNEVYIARQGSILHYNDSGDISTLDGAGFRILPEGIIMSLHNFKEWRVVETFETKSPFLFI
jgi:glucosamine--fructose-6-phosphate aminotransferase (isomerizing)